jgi:hypothetical protein
MGMNARFRVNNEADGVYNLSLTKTISRTSAVATIFWNSKAFQMFPHMTELLIRVLMKGCTGRILLRIVEKLFPEISPPFKLFPFSIDPIYDQIKITASDGSGMKHRSMNGNLWFTCNGPNMKNRYVEITFPNSK